MSGRPIMIAVGGDSGSGKAALCRGIERIYGTARLAIVSLDDYHSLDREQRRLVDITALDPRASNFAAMEEDLWALREGRAIEKPVYRHRSGTFGPAERLEPKDVVIVQGLFPLYTRALRSLFDVTVWCDPEPVLKTAWKIQRDTLERGYREDEVRAEIERRRGEVGRYVQPQSTYADLTLTFYRPSGWGEAGDPTRLSARIRKGGRFRALDYSEFESPSTSIKQSEQTGGGGFPETVIDLDGGIDRATAKTVEERLWQHIRSGERHDLALLGEFTDAQGTPRQSDALALAQLLIARRISLIEEELLERAQ